MRRLRRGVRHSNGDVVNELQNIVDDGQGRNRSATRGGDRPARTRKLQRRSQRCLVRQQGFVLHELVQQARNEGVASTRGVDSLDLFTANPRLTQVGTLREFNMKPQIEKVREAMEGRSIICTGYDSTWPLKSGV